MRAHTSHTPRGAQPTVGLSSPELRLEVLDTEALPMGRTRAGHGRMEKRLPLSCSKMTVTTVTANT